MASKDLQDALKRMDYYELAKLTLGYKDGE